MATSSAKGTSDTCRRCHQVAHPVVQTNQTLLCSVCSEWKKRDKAQRVQKERAEKKVFTQEYSTLTTLLLPFAGWFQHVCKRLFCEKLLCNRNEAADVAM